MEGFKTSSKVNNFITRLIEIHYPYKDAPKWVNYHQFSTTMYDLLVERLIDHLKDDPDSDTYTDYNLLFAYTSNWFDSGICLGMDDSATIKIPHAVIQLYHQLAAHRG